MIRSCLFNQLIIIIIAIKMLTLASRHLRPAMMFRTPFLTPMFGFGTKRSPEEEFIEKGFEQGIQEDPNVTTVFKDAWVTKLINRSILSVRGRDATSLLQNTSTTDMMTFKKEGKDRAAIYSAFLNVKGKTMFDAFIVRPVLANQCDEDTEYWLDLHEDDIDPLRKHLHKYALRKNVKIEDISHIIKSFSIQTIMGVKETEGHFFKRLQDEVEMHPSEEFPGSFETDVAAFVDPRTKENGVRVLCCEQSFEPEKDVLIMKNP